MGTAVHPPKGVSDILSILKKNGCEAYAVGGCVRDSVMGVEPKDWDIASNALPSFIKELFPRTVDTGLRHGTVTVLLEGEAFEVTTFRIDGKYGDNRHPEQVSFTGSLEEDLRRRDFTINAMAWNEERGLVDPFGGMGDIAAGIIRCVGDPNERFREDALRMLRAVRFAARLGFRIEPGTKRGIAENSWLILNISSERIREELTGILTADYPMEFIILRDTGLLRRILPELEACFGTLQNNPHHIYNVGEHSIHSVAAIENDRCLRWAMLLHDAGKAVTRTTDEKGVDHFYGHAARSVEIAEDILRRLKFDNRSLDRILRLIRYHDREIIPKPNAVARAVNQIGEDIFPELLKMKRADKSAQNPEDMDKGLEAIGRIEEIYLELRKRKHCLNLKDLAVNGEDLIRMGFKKGPEIGKVLQALFDRVLADPALNDRETLEGMAFEMLGKNLNEIDISKKDDEIIT